MLTLPTTLEREYGVFQKRVVLAVAERADLAVLGQTLRQDDENHPNLVAMLALLGITASEIINEAKLKRALRSLARRLGAEKQAELIALTGVFVREPAAITLEPWVEQQAAAITAATDRWLAAASTIIESGRGSSLSQVRAELAASATERAAKVSAIAAAAVLALNSGIVSERAQSIGITHYRWVTSKDSKVRSNHADLNDTIQAWAEPPMGGGTKPGDTGHPGSGHQCRCMTELITRNS